MKAICIVKEHPELQAMLDGLAALDKSFDETLKFLEKQAKNAARKKSDESQKIWDSVKDHLVAKDLIRPGERDSLVFSYGTHGVLFSRHKGEEDPSGPAGLLDALSRLFDRK